MASPANRALARLLVGLTKPQLDALRRGDVIRFASRPRADELPLPADMERAFRATRPRGNDRTMPLTDPRGSAGLRQRAKQSEEAWAAATGYRVTVRMEPTGRDSRGFLHLHAIAEPVHDRGAPAGIFAGSPDTRFAVTASGVDTHRAALQDTPTRRAALQKDPLLGARKRLRPQAIGPRPAWLPPRRPLLRELLPELARAYGVHFLSDAYWSASPVFEAPGGAALFEILDASTRGRQRWERRGSVIRLRSDRWFLDRPREVPLRLVRRWKAVGNRHGALPLEELVTIAATLTDAQLETLHSLVFEVELPVTVMLALHNTHRARHALRLYRALTPAQQQALWRGVSLPVAKMTPPQRALFLAAEKEWKRAAAVAPARGPNRPAPAFMLASRPMVRTVGSPSSRYGIVRPENPPAPARPPQTAGRVGSPGAAAPLARAPASSPGTRDIPVTHVEFRFRFGLERNPMFTLEVARR